MHSVLGLDDDELLDRFERCDLPDGFPHAAHLRVAWIHVDRHGAAEGAARVTAGIRRLAAEAGTPDRYHETMTRAWVELVASAAEAYPAADSRSFLAAVPELLDKGLLARHYSAERLAQGRTRFVEPDLAPLAGAHARA